MAPISETDPDYFLENYTNGLGILDTHEAVPQPRFHGKFSQRKT